MSRRTTILAGSAPACAVLVAALSSSAPCLAQEKQPEKKDDDVILDNRDLGKKKKLERHQERKKQQEEFGSDTPFADSAPNPVEQREEKWEPGFGGSFRLGWGFPTGRVEKDVLVDITGLIFAWADVGYWFIPYLFAGINVSGGHVLIDCSGDVSCSGWQLRGGPELIARFLPFQSMTPWLGVGAGYELLTFGYSVGPVELDYTYSGFEMLNVQAGFDVRARGQMFGLFALYSMGKYSNRKVTFTDSSDSSDPRQATHGWLGIGARGTFD